MPKKKNRNTAEHQKDNTSRSLSGGRPVDRGVGGAQPQSNKLHYGGGGGGGFGTPCKSDNGAGGSKAPQQLNPAPTRKQKAQSWASPPTWDSVGTDTTPAQPSSNYNSSVDGVEDWNESAGFIEDPAPVRTAIQDAPPPKVNVWQQRIEFYQAAVPTSVDEEERMLQAALEMSRIEEEKEKLRLKLEEEELSAAVVAADARVETVCRGQSEAAKDQQSLYAYNGTVPPLKPAGPQPDLTQLEEPWPATSTTVSIAPSSPIWTDSNRAEPDKTRTPGFQRGVGRGNRWSRQSSRTLSGSSDANSEVSVGHVQPRSPPRPEPKTLPHQLQVQYKQLSQHKPQPKTTKQEDAWYSGSDYEDGLEVGNDRDSGSRDLDTKPDRNTCMADKDQINVDANSNTATSNSERGQAIPIHLTNGSNASLYDDGGISKVTQVTANSTSTSSTAKKLEPFTTGTSWDAAQSGTRVLRRQYGPRARGRKTAAVCVPKIPSVPSIPATMTGPDCQTVQNTSIPVTQLFTEEDTSAKLLNLCSITQKSQTENNQDFPKESIFGDLSSETKPVCDNHQKQGHNPDISSRSSATTLPNTAAPLDLSKQATLPTSNVTNFVPGNDVTNNNPIAGLPSQLRELGLGRNIWSQQFMNAPNSWAASSSMGDTMTSKPQQISSSNSESSNSTSNCSPDLPDVQGEDNPHNPIVNIKFPSYASPYMNFCMYGMGYPGIPVAPGVSLGQPPTGATDGIASSPQQNIQMPGIMPFGILPGMLPQMGMSGHGMPGIPIHGMPGQRIPMLAGQGILGMPGQGMPVMHGQPISSMPGQREPNMPVEGVPDKPREGVPDMTGQGIPDMPGQGVPDIPGQGVPDMPGQEVPDMPGQEVPDMPGQEVPDMPGQGVPDMPGQGVSDMPGQGVPTMPGQGVPAMPDHGVPGMAGNGVLGMLGPGRPETTDHGVTYMTGLGLPGTQVPGMAGAGVPGMTSHGVPGISGKGVPGMPSSGLPGMPGYGVPGISAKAVPSMGVPAVPYHGVTGISGKGVPGMPGPGVPGMHGQGVTGISGKGVPFMSGIRVPGMPGQGISGKGFASLPGSVVPNMTGHGVTGISGKGGPDMPGPRVPGNGVTDTTRQGVAGMTGQGMLSMTQQGIPWMTGQGMQGNTGQGMQGTTSHEMTNMTGQGMTGTTGQGVLGMSEQRVTGSIGHIMTGMTSQGVTSMTGHGMQGNQVMSGMTQQGAPGMTGHGIQGATGHGVTSMTGQSVRGITRQGVQGAIGHGIQGLPAQEVMATTGQGVICMTGEEVPAMTGQRLIGATGQRVTDSSGQGVPCMTGQRVSGMTSQGVPGAPNHGVQGMTGQGLQGEPGRGMPGQGMPSMSGQGMPGMHAQGMPGQGMLNMTGQGIPGMPYMPFQAMPGISSQELPGMPQKLMPGMPHQATLGMPGPARPDMLTQHMASTSSQTVPVSNSCQAIPGMSAQASQGLPSYEVPAHGMPPGLKTETLPSHRSISPSPPLPAAQPTSSTQAGSGPWDGSRMMNGLVSGGMPQYRLPFGNFQSDGSVPTFGEQGHSLLPKHGVSPPLLPPGMPMMPGMMPFLPTMPILPYQYSRANVGTQEKNAHPSQFNVTNVD